jgi:hypothetical protein
MDRAKAGMIVESGLEVARCCGTCACWTSRRGGAWGTCERFRYTPETSPQDRPMPAPKLGCCGGWSLGDDCDIHRFLQLAAEVAAESNEVVDSSCGPQAAVG